MKKPLRKTHSKLTSLFSFLGYCVTELWVDYSYFRTACFLAYFPIFMILTWSIQAVFLITFPLIVFFLIMDSKKSVVVWKDPEAFIKSEKINRIVDILFYIVVTSFFVGIISSIASITFSLGSWIDYVIIPTAWIFFFGGGLIPLVFLNVTPAFIMDLPEKVRKHLNFFFKLYVSPMLRVRARLCVVLDVLSENPNRRTIRKKTPLFKESLRIYNSHLTLRYDFVLRDPDKFYKYVRLVALFDDREHIKEINENLSSLIKLMEKKEEDPFEFVRTVKTMIGESVVKPSDLYDEIEIEPQNFRKRIYAYSGLIKFLITALLTLIGSIVIPMMLK